MIKFFPFWLYFENLRNNNLLANFFAIDSLFIKANLGIFFAIKFSYLFFVSNIISAIVIFAAATLIIYSLIRVYQARHFKLIAIYLCIINLGLILICLALHSEKSGQAAFFYWLNFNLVNLFIFIFATFLKRKFSTSSLEKIFLMAPDKMLVLPLKMLIIFIAAFPFTLLFYGNWYLALETLQFDARFVNAPVFFVLVMLNFVLLVLSIRIATKIFFPPHNLIQAKLAVDPYKYWLHPISFWLLIVIIYGSIFYSEFLNKLSSQFIM